MVRSNQILDIFEKSAMGFSERLNVGHERKGSQRLHQYFWLEQIKKGVALNSRGGSCGGGEIKILILDMLCSRCVSEIQGNMLIHLDIQVWSLREVFSADINL